MSRICQAILVGSLFLTSCLTLPRQTITPEQLTPTPVSTAIANDITVSAGNFRLEGAYLAADVCFDKPTDEDWGIEEATLWFGTQQVEEWGAEFLDVPEPSGSSPGLRCDILRFPVGLSTSIETFTITISAIAAHPPNGERCSQQFQVRLQRELADRNSAITASIECEEMREIFVVSSKPSDMTMEEAQAVVADVYLEIIGRKGPWVLEGRLD